jgi:hypothetical protein
MLAGGLSLVTPLNKWGSHHGLPTDIVLYAYAALMYVLVPMPCLFFGGGSTQFLTSKDGGG